ncbi:MAG TPA: M13 family metallopeptidase [Usitatibacter sp.]|nr:M13 family metallopeptidase [Usitatibacter sp.]
MRTRYLLLSILLAASPAALPQGPDRPLKQLPYSAGLDPASMDRSADPCTDLYQFSCGGWVKANPIPPDQSSWSVYSKLAQDNLRFLWGILEEAARPAPGRSAVQRKIGDYFAACMDEAAIEKRGAAPLKPALDAIASLRSNKELPALLARLQLETGSSGFFFGFGSNQDFADSSQVIAFATSGGLGLPDRDYYTKGDDKSRELREKYFAHVARMFQLLGDPAESARANAATVLAIEDQLARATLTRVEQRDPYNLYHRIDRAALVKSTPQLSWEAYLKPMGLTTLQAFNVTEPRFFAELDKLLAARPATEIRTYLRWHYARANAPFLSKAFVDESFDFYSKTLHGVPQLKPRWKRCVAWVDGQLGEALGQEFVRLTFPPGTKDRILRMTQQVERAMEEDVKALPWMGEATKKRALEKLHTIVNKIGYPEKWRDYSSVQVRRDDFFGNVRRAQVFESRRDLAKIGKPVDRSEWYMTPPTVNAYYNPQTNDINFAAGILQPPLFDPKMDDAPNYGNTGATIGHELTHGFDDQGRKYDAKGDLKDWWTPEDGKAFEERAKCISDQFSTYTIVDDIKINGELTNGEDIADLGGMVLAWMAWKMQVGDKALPPIDGLTPEQRFFVGNAQWACDNTRDETKRVRAVTDPHSPGKWRVNGPVANMPEFAQAFSCKPGAPLNPPKRCRVW